MIRGKDAPRQELTHIGGCMHNSYDLKTLMDEMSVADIYNGKNNSKNKYLQNYDENSK